MKTKILSLLFFSTVLLFTEQAFSQAPPRASDTAALYVCLPCGNDCDVTTYTKPGQCPHCGMALVKKETVRFKNIQANEICDYIKAHPAAVLLDVRTRDEFDGKHDPDYGRLKNAINIPIQELSSRLSEIDSLKSKEILVYCSHSHRSPQASYLLMQNGFANVTNMLGGMSIMKDNGCKVAANK